MTAPYSGSMTVNAGDLAPDFLAFLPEPLRTADWTVLYFYPRGNNPHCVMQSRRFQALLPQFREAGVRVVGVSVDTAEEQGYFRNFCTLSFPLISDARHELSARYGVLDSAVVDGETVTYARRETFLIRPDGRVALHWTQVDPDTHAAQVLGAVKALTNMPA
ncbi:peroxiredoxin [Deinococcus aquiradiocola]|uniref:thioredoxin-dependent peroxiredoxin n=2 Tax=Deinococcus aquiradiocola TaxID=393059 RepID=A0A917P990_9DEIO|nr:peroxiredoxin [Deinococcus aquiradiocola]